MKPHIKKDHDNVDKRSIPTRGRRGVCLNIPKVKSSRYYRSFRYRAIDKWNKLDPNLTIDDQIMFKSKVKALYVNPYVEIIPMESVEKG